MQRVDLACLRELTGISDEVRSLHFFFFFFFFTIVQVLSPFLNFIGSAILALACLAEVVEDAGVIGTLHVSEELFITVQILLHSFKFNLMGSIFLGLL